MKCMVCGREIEDGAACCDQCKEKMARGVGPERVEDEQAVSELGEVQSSDIAVTKKKSKKWLLVAIPLLLVVILIGIGVSQKSNMSDIKPAITIGENGDPVFNISPEQFCEELLKPNVFGDRIVSTTDMDDAVAIEIKNGIVMFLQEDSIEGNLNAVFFTMSVPASVEQLVYLEASVAPVGNMLSGKTGSDNSELTLAIFDVVSNNTQKKIITKDELVYQIYRDDVSVKVIIIPE